jgi:DNA recombination protein RmuC
MEWIIVGILVLALIFMVYRHIKLVSENASLKKELEIKNSEDLGEKFKLLATSALKDTRQELEFENKKQLDPIEKVLNKFEKQISEMELKREGAYSGLTEQMGTLLNQTSSLSKAMSSSQARGRWGEIQLRKIVEMAGMLEYCDFTEQKGIKDSNSDILKPDMIIKLPNKRTVVLDSKVPTDKYVEAVEEKNETLKKQKFEEYVKVVRDTAKKLSTKAYWDNIGTSVDFVIMFIPGEAFYRAVIEASPALIEESSNNKVIIASPVILIALLKTIEHGWRQKDQEENAKKIIELGKEFYERILTVSNHLKGLGSSLQGSLKKYNETVSSVESRLLISARKFKDLKVSDKEIPNLDESQVDGSVREISLEKEEVAVKK